MQSSFPIPRDLLAQILPASSTLVLDSLTYADDRITAVLQSQTQVAPCQACQVLSTHRHSQYRRTLQDLPWGHCALQLQLILRKFRCRNDTCPRRIFAEPISTIAAPRVRRTTAVSTLVEALGLRVSGADSARLLQRMGIRVSPNTILRAVRRLPLPTPPTVQIVGVDDWSWRKGQRFGTMLVDLEQHRVAALLPERTPESTAAWLATHPTITTVTRDRSGIYADGIRQGAPTAVQVADRWHLVKNLSEALERFLLGQRTVLRAAASTIHPDQVAIAHDPSPYGAEPRPPRQEAAETRSLQQHARLVEAYGRVHDLRAKGADLADIARMVGISRSTVYRYLHMATPPERKQRQMPPTALAAFIPYLTTRWNEGCHNGMRLWREIKQQGYPHSAAPVLRFLHAQLRPARPSARHPVVSRRVPRAPTAGQVARCWIRDAATWTEDEQAYQSALLAADPGMVLAYDLTVAFVTMVRQRTGAEQFAPWLEKAQACSISALCAFAQSLEKDRDAVQAGLTVAWNNGQLEGQINRLKLIKRQSYGRAGFDLLQRRVLLRI